MESPTHHTNQDVRRRVPWAALLVVLNAALLGAAALVALRTGIILSQGEHLVEVERSAFAYREEPTDIVLEATPATEETYVLYTNYACPYCAEVHAAFAAAQTDATSGLPQPSVVRLHFLGGNGGRFATQELVSAYMLRLWREDPTRFDSLEDELFEQQDDWATLDETTLLSWLNERAGLGWTADDVAAEREELLDAQVSSPEDLIEVPSLYSDGKLHSGLVYALV